jgi:hypothetical protein
MRLRWAVGGIVKKRANSRSDADILKSSQITLCGVILVQTATAALHFIRYLH